MAKKKEIKEIKQPDFFMRIIITSYEWIKNNLKTCIVGATVFVLIIACLVGYIIYENKKDERIQGLFVQGMQVFREYTITGKEESLDKAEGIFNNIATESGKKMKALSKLYLGRIYYLKGKNEEAVKAYKEAQTLSDADIIKIVSQKALEVLEKK
ncbi:MAG: hypothetical protein KBE27_01970 [Syntrophorhabdaceae bacterium]|nr:hypothetical protein [Syntrophorhabdales bacterium]MBP9560571.1 hypothetical protein [Syntrophorhabdaceae bacterium]